MDRRIVRLSYAHRSSYFMATLWSVSNRTDGHFERGDLDLIPTFDPSSVATLVDGGLWVATETGWVDVDFETVQTSRDDLERMDNMRRADRDKKARQRAHKAGHHHLCTPDTCNESPGDIPGVSPSFKSVPGDSPGDASRGHNRIGQERRGKDQSEASPIELAPEITGDYAPCCGEEHGPMESCPRDQFRGAPKTSDPGYCPPPCGRTFVNGVCPKCSAKKEKTA